MQRSKEVDFNHDIRPILSENCYACHGPDDAKRKSGLRLDIKEEAFKPAKSGAVAIVPGDAAKSELVRRLTTEDEDDRMPPVKSGKHLTRDQIELLRQWISQGAKWKEHWSYIKPEPPSLPSVKNKTWPQNPIDYFVLARQEKEDLNPSPEASRETLVRRLSLDLIGLPPTVEEVERFLKDDRADAYERLVERLLDSPHFGERWARPWLDQARYADSNGYEADMRRSIWPYRDWVINALNSDLPFDQFTVEQIAGDLLPKPTREQKIATGFHRNTMVNTEGGTDEEEFRTAALVDRVNTTFEVWMGTTLGCAQCHNHKYDPFTQKEYYQVLALFNQTKDKGRSNEPEMDLPTPEQKAKREEIKSKIELLEKILNTQTPALEDAQSKWETTLREHFSGIDANWLTIDPETFKATDGVALQKLADNSILSSGAVSETNTYEVTARTTVRGINAIRLQALVDDRLPQKSSGRSDEGDFVLTEFTVETLPTGPGKEQATKLPRFGNWYSLGPFTGSTVSDAFKKAFIVETNIDLAQTYEKGQLRWTERPDFSDRQAHSLAGENAATYLYRTITAEEEMPLLISLGSDDGIQVWLNGKKILSREVIRPVGPDQDSVELQLIKGENRLLMKINNGDGDYAFYFAVSDDQSAVNRVKFETAYADFSMEKYDVKDAIDGDPKTGWSIAAHEATNRVNHQAVFVPKKPMDFEPDTHLVIRLKQESNRSQHLLGRFRLSFSTASGEAHRAWGKVPAKVRGFLELPAEKLSEEQKKELAKYYRSIDPELDKIREQIAELRKQEPKDVPTTLVMEQADTNRTTHILIRGSHLNKGPEVTPGVPAILHPLPAGEPTNRLTFARWLVDPANPLVGRVTMNRIWAQYFGRGLVETSEEFGAQGELPTHLDLLDWLATELIRQNWSLKAMHRLIVNSATYRQSTAAAPELYQRDPYNRLLARGPRFRMEAEMIRDNALAVSGLLSRKIGGPSVFPYQPEGVWNSPYNGDKWNTSKNGDEFRRGIYTFWRRTASYASFMAFDAPSREVSCERRPRSNTPVQALVTLNDPAFLSAANALARRIMNEGGTDTKARLDFSFKCCLARRPSPIETGHFLKLYEESWTRFAENSAAAKAMALLGQATPVTGSDTLELAAWTVVSNVLLNLDETLTKG